MPTNLNQTTSVNGVALTWDHNGNLDQHGTTDYQWTLGNRLWRVVKPTSTTEYAYDSTDRRTVVIEDGVMTRTLWSGSDEVGEYEAAGALRRRFIPDGTGAMDARLAMVAADGTVSWFHTNHQGSVIAMSNGSGAAIAVANYSEYGKFGADASGNPLTAPAGGSPFGYTGRQWDAKAGLYNYRARYYDPALGVFLSMDPIGSQDDPNLYMYVGNDPVNKTDPTGRQAIPLPLPPPPVPMPGTGGDNIFTQAQADLAQSLTETVTQAREAFRDRNAEAALNLDTNALIAAIEQPGTPQGAAVEAAMADKKVFVSPRAVDEFMAQGSWRQLGVFLVRNNAHLRPSAPNAMVDQLVDRGLSRSDAEVMASGLYAGSAPALTRDRRILTRVPEFSRRY